MDWEIIDEHRVYDGHFKVDQLRIKHELFEGGDSAEVLRESVGRGNAVAVVSYDPWREKIVLVEQFRAGAIGGNNPWMLELVAGLIDPGETTESVAHREVLEELGCTLKALRPIMSFYTSPGGNSEHVYLFLGILDSREVQPICGLEHEGEDIRTHVLIVDEVFKRLAEGKISSAISIIGLQWLQANHQVIRSEWLED